MKKIKSILALVACAGILHATDTTSVQKQIVIQSVSMNGIINGNGFGLQYVPAVGIRFGERMVVSAGPMFNAINWQRTGSFLRTSYILLRENKSYSGHSSLSFGLSIVKINGARLSPASVACEKQAATALINAEPVNFEQLHYSGWEYSAGFNLHYRCRCGLIFRTGISCAYTNAVQKNADACVTYRPSKIVSLQLGGGIGWEFGKMMDKEAHMREMIAEEQNEDGLLPQQ